MKIKKRRPVILLEILIALFLVAIAIFPLLYPHVAILKEEIRLTKELELYPKLAAIHANVLIDLHSRKYPIELLKKGIERPITKEELGLAFEGTLLLSLDKKRREGTNASKYLLNVDYSLKPVGGSGRPVEAHYQYFVKGPPVARQT